MKKLIKIALFVILATCSGLNTLFSQEINKDEIYKNSFRPDIPRALQEIPFEDQDYKKTHYSPYALVRIPRKVRHKKETLHPGMYLVKLFTENNVDYLLFKNMAVAKALIPIENKTELPKKIKNMQLDVIEDNHGKNLILVVKFKRNSYIATLEVVGN